MTKRMLTDENFDKSLAACPTPYMVEFFATWCGHCQRMAPIIDELIRELNGKVAIFQADIDIAVKKSDAYNVSATPTMVLFKHGKAVKEIVGEKSKEALKEELLALL